ncbi:MAG: 30S ribosomal protein S1 [Alphaproteobacteria bacterium]
MTQENTNMESFEALLNESLGASELEGAVLRGTVVGIDGDSAIVDVGLKSEGRVLLREFDEGKVTVGEKVDVFLERMEDRDGMVVLSREKAGREEKWIDLNKIFEAKEQVSGEIMGRVKGGFTVDIEGVTAFLPGSQIDVRPIRDLTPLMGTPQPFMILKMDRKRGNIVVSRRAILEESRAEVRNEIMSTLAEGQVLEGTVKNITDYGAFVDLGGIDGLLHVTDITWRRIGHPTEVLSIGQQVKVQITKFNAETQRISLGMRQLEEDPWKGLEGKYPSGTKFTGRVTNITDYGAFIEMEPGIEGLVHISEMSWTKKAAHPSKIVSTSQEIEVMVLEIDEERRRISLGMKQCADNPWNSFGDTHKTGDVLEGEISNITEFGLFVGIPGGIDGMVHLSDLSWEQAGDEALAGYKKGDKVNVKVLDIDIAKERVSLGIKQLTEDNVVLELEGIKKGDVVTCTVKEVSARGVEVIAGDKELVGFIKRNDLAKEKNDQRLDRFAVGEKIDAKVTSLNKETRKLNLSIKALEIQEQKAAMAEYGSSDSGASLGDILGAALKKDDDKKKK